MLSSVVNPTDLVFALGGGILTVGLIPTLRARVQMPYSSSLSLAAVLTSWVPVQASMGLGLAAVTTAIQAACWWALVGIRRYDG